MSDSTLKLESAAVVGSVPEMIEEFLREKYLFRRNILNNKYEVAPVGPEPKFETLTTETQNKLVWDVCKEFPDATGLKSYVDMFIHSDYTPKYDPIAEYLNHLPEWDGKNRLGDLAAALPGMSCQQTEWFCVWFRSMVAHWLQMDCMHGNDMVLLLMGDQGCGKSTFCQRLLPAHLREYYLDHLNLGNKFDRDMALTNNLIVNIDEFDQYSGRTQAVVKYLISTPKVNSRRAYGRVQIDSPRYASFMATTNSRTPLNDPTGSRRFICVEIPSGQYINNLVDIDYDQLYAQVVHELKEQHLTYWLNNEEVEELQNANSTYQSEPNTKTIIENCFILPRDESLATSMTMDEICDHILTVFPALQLTHIMKLKLAAELRNQKFIWKHTNKGNVFLVRVKNSMTVAA